MKEYIEKERALQLLEENASDDEVFFAARAIEAEPPADVKPAVRGEWIKLDMHCGEAQYKCSACGMECYVPECMYEPLYAFCPNCGAEMRKEDT